MGLLFIPYVLMHKIIDYFVWTCPGRLHRLHIFFDFGLDDVGFGLNQSQWKIGDFLFS